MGFELILAFLLLPHNSVFAFLPLDVPRSTKEQSKSLTCRNVHSAVTSPLSRVSFNSTQFLASFSESSSSQESTNENEVATRQGREPDEGGGSAPAEAENIQKLCQLLEASTTSPNHQLRLESTENDGVRGVYIDQDIPKDGIILSIPLGACLQDSNIPEWMESLEDRIDWATRLAANLLDLELRPKQDTSLDQGRDLWLSMLPDREYLKASLPVHWPEETASSARCTALELAVDSAYFVRAEAVEDLFEGLSESNLVDGKTPEEVRSMCHSALDLVQTRSCRLVEPTKPGEDNDPRMMLFSSESTPPIRALAPIFDFINHGASTVDGGCGANAYFGLEKAKEGNQQALVVRALRDLAANEEVLIDYGSSAKPAWKCLVSYGFVPQFSDPSDSPSTSSDENGDIAELFMDGCRFEVGPSWIPTELVTEAMASIQAESGEPIISANESSEEAEQEEIVLTPQLALRIARRISDVAYQLLLEPEPVEFSSTDDDPSKASSAFQVVSNQLAASLRWSQHRVLLACAKGLHDQASGE